MLGIIYKGFNAASLKGKRIENKYYEMVKRK